MFKLILFILTILPHVRGYCIYNFSNDSELFIRQEPMNTGGNYWSRFKVDRLKPGDRACCPYSSFDCDRNSNPDDMMQLAFKTYRYDQDTGSIYSVNLPAGGWLEFRTGEYAKFEIEVFNPDGTPFQYELQRNVKGLLLN